MNMKICHQRLLVGGMYFKKSFVRWWKVYLEYTFSNYYLVKFWNDTQFRVMYLPQSPHPLLIWGIKWYFLATLKEEMSSRLIGRCKILGILMNFAPLYSYNPNILMVLNATFSLLSRNIAGAINSTPSSYDFEFTRDKKWVT